MSKTAADPNAPVVVKDAKGQDVTLSRETVAQLVKAAQPEGAVDLSAKVTELSTSLASATQQIDAMRTENVKLELARKTDAATRKVEAAISSGTMLPRDKDNFIQLALSNETLFDAMMKDRPKLIDLNREIGTGADVNAATAHVGEIAAAVQTERTANPKLTEEQAYSLALQKNPKLYELASRQ